MGLHQDTRLAKKDPRDNLDPGITPRQGFAEAAKDSEKKEQMEVTAKNQGKCLQWLSRFLL